MRYKDGLAAYVLLLVVLVGALLAPVAPAVAETLACAEQSSVLVCDADGPSGPVRPISVDSVVVISADGTSTVVSLWTVAAGAAVFLAALTACVVRRRIAHVSYA